MNPVAIDIETPLITPECQHPPVATLSICWDGMSATIVASDDRDAMRAALLDVLEHGDPIIGHHVSYDLICIALDYPSLLPAIRKALAELRIEDTEERERLYAIARGYYEERAKVKGSFSLGHLASTRLGMVLEGKGGVQLSYGTLLGRPLSEYTAEQIGYAEKDTIATWLLHSEQDERYRKKISRKGYTNDRYQARRQWCASWASHHGMGASPERVAEFEARLMREYATLSPAMEAHGIVRWHQGKYSKNVKKIQSLVAAAYGGEPPLTKKGGVKTDDQTLKESGHPLLMTIADYQHIAKMVNNDLVALKAAARHRQHPYYRMLKTGRVQGSKPNLMNVPTRWGVRDCYEPAPGHVYVDCDYSGLELRTWAQVCLWMLGYSRLSEFLNDGRDAHLEMASKLLRITYDEALTRHKARKKALLDKLPDPHPEIKTARDIGKRANFGLQGGMGAVKFADTSRKAGVFMSDERAAEVKNVWLDTWPEAPAYLDAASKMVGGLGKRTSGEQYVSGRIRGGMIYTECANTFFQGLAADGMIYAWWLIQEACMTEGDDLYGCKVVGVIHDQFLVEAPEEKSHEAAMRVSELMCSGMAAYVPDIKIEAEPVITRRWLKEAEQVWVDGRLRPYEPEE